jgi:hypothetical protein
MNSGIRRFFHHRIEFPALVWDSGDSGNTILNYLLLRHKKPELKKAGKRSDKKDSLTI